MVLFYLNYTPYGTKKRIKQSGGVQPFKDEAQTAFKDPVRTAQ